MVDKMYCLNVFYVIILDNNQYIRIKLRKMSISDEAAFDRILAESVEKEIPPLSFGRRTIVLY